MFKHDKNLLEIVKVEKSNPTYAAMLTEQLGGPHGELKAAMQYISQSFRVNNPEIKDLLMDIAAEELSHMEMVATAVNLLNGNDANARAVQSGHIESQVMTGLSPYLASASGVPWTATYVDVTGDLPADLLSNIAAEQRAKVVYEYLYRQINDKHVKLMIDFLLNREEAHNSLFREAFTRIKDTGSQRDWGVDKDARLYFNLSKPGKYFDLHKPQPPAFQNPDQARTH